MLQFTTRRLQLQLGLPHCSVEKVDQLHKGAFLGYRYDSERSRVALFESASLRHVRIEKLVVRLKLPGRSAERADAAGVKWPAVNVLETCVAFVVNGSGKTGNKRHLKELQDNILRQPDLSCKGRSLTRPCGTFIQGQVSVLHSIRAIFPSAVKSGKTDMKG